LKATSLFSALSLPAASVMQSEWANQTISPKPQGHPAVVWAEEVLRASGKSLFASALSRCVLGASAGGAPTYVVGGAIMLFVLAARLSDCMPILGKPVEDKPYHSFGNFWPRYLAEHREPRDRVAHVFEFLGVVLFMAMDPSRLVALALTVALGSLLTRPLLHLGRPRLENHLMYLIGGVVAQRLDVPISFALGYGVWLAFDYVGHAYLGENASAAAFLGRHYLGWALLGQAHFAFQVAANFPQEVFVAKLCVKARAADAGRKIAR